MEYTPQRPMSIDQFKARTAYKYDARRILVFGALGALLLGCVRSCSALFTPDPSLGSTWLIIAVSIGAMIVCLHILDRSLLRVDHQWHYYRGEVEAVGELVTAQDAGGAAVSYYPVYFAGDKGETRFSPEDYARQADALQPGKCNVLVVRRSMVLGSPVYEAAARVPVRVS